MLYDDEPVFDPKNMPFRRLGNSGLRVPLFSFGGWLTIGGTVKGDTVKELLTTCFESGINMFDTAEGYSEGRSEIEIGRVVREMGWKRSDLIITTKLFFGYGRKEPNAKGLSRKHIIEGLNDSLARLRMDYVDIVYAHRPDKNVPMEETVRAFNHVIDKGMAFYWGTSEWSAREIEEAHHAANRLGLMGPIAEQCQYNLLHRERPEVEYAPLYAKYGMGATVFSALSGGILTGKYGNGKIDPNTRLDNYKTFFRDTIKGLQDESDMKLARVKQLEDYARDELGCTVAQLALAWVAAQNLTSTVILGASRPEQILENMKALEIIPKITPDVHQDIIDIMKHWEPHAAPRYRDEPSAQPPKW
ncbi:Aldo/keto reductase [Auricularia subglabra TFB-10046 SS5]|nr:Aldo/keto reductase [Auricularia subglabra TFB-10046 SS5]